MFADSVAPEVAFAASRCTASNEYAAAPHDSSTSCAAAPIASDCCAGTTRAASECIDDTRTPDIPSGPLSLDMLLEQVSIQLTHCKSLPLSARLKVKALLAQFDDSMRELERFKLSDPGKLYTRNLIASDDTFTLMLLCWNPGKASPIHDHPCNGCWMRVLCGRVDEHRYIKDESENKLVKTGYATASPGDVIYIDDSIGFHKVANPSFTEPACTLHLYSPPFTSCQIWLDETRADKALRPVVTYHSEFGELVSYEKPSELTGGACSTTS